MSVDDKTYREVVEFLYREAELLDEGLLEEWIKLVSDDIEYAIPVRISKERAAGSGLLSDSHYVHDDKRGLLMKVEKFMSEYSWSEDPPSRVRHMITNILVEPRHDGEEEVEVKSNVLFTRFRLDKSYPELISYGRKDVLRRENGEWKLIKRLVLLDHSVLLAENITIPY